MDTLKAESTEAVWLFRNESSRWFAKEVIDCMNHAFDVELSHANSKGSPGDLSSYHQVSCKYSIKMLYINAVYVKQYEFLTTVHEWIK